MSNRQSLKSRILWTVLCLCITVSFAAAQEVSYKTSAKEIHLLQVQNHYVVGFKNPIPSGGAYTAKPSVLDSMPIKKILDQNTAVISLNKTGKDAQLTTMAANDEVAYLYPVYCYKRSRSKVYPQPQVTVRIRENANIDEIAAQYDLNVVAPLLYTNDQFILSHGSDRDPFEVSNQLWKDRDIIWANPNVRKELKKRFQPNDPLYPQQWHLNNTGQGGGTVGADVSAEEAWDLQQPDENIVIAIVDDGVQTDHPDLNIYVNPAEKNGTPGVDDDGNGLVDDVNGWDFSQNDNNPYPDRLEESDDVDAHGTSVSGVAAAIGNNNRGVAGAAFGCPILPVKIMQNGGDIADEASVANALRYAAKHADVVNNSWGGDEMSDVESDALDFAATAGSHRGSKGVPVLFATGNDAAIFARFDSYESLYPGQVTIEMVYKKDQSGSDGEDKVWIEKVGLIAVDLDTYEELDYIEVMPTSTQFPSGISSKGDKQFTIEPDILAEGGYVFVSGDIGDSQESVLVWNTTVPDDGQDWFFAVNFTISSQEPTGGTDGDVFAALNPYGSGYMEGYAYFGTNEFEPPFSGVPPENIAPLVGQNLHPGVINIGASNNYDVRSNYSQWGPEIDFVAPSDGGSIGIITTDLTGTGNGYDPNSNYTEAKIAMFGGTSSACPLASGIFAMMLSANPDLSVDEMIQIGKETADKIGAFPYDSNGFNEYTGYGKLNMAAAVQRALELKQTDITGWELH